MRADLNDFAYFAEVVRHGGFAAAGRALHEPKSKLSRRIAGLEERLGLRLIERTSRRFRVTDTGQAFYERCRAMLDEAEQAEALVMRAQAEPYGRIRFSCPTGMVGPVSDLITSFLTRYPKVRLQLVATDRAVDIIGERIDLALRVRVDLTTDAELTVRSLGRSVGSWSPARSLQVGRSRWSNSLRCRHCRRMTSTTPWIGIWRPMMGAGNRSVSSRAWVAPPLIS